MKRIAILLGVVGASLILTVPFRAHAFVGMVIITEIQTGGPGNANDEFVKVANPTLSDVDVTGWKLQYKAATSTAWATRATLSGAIAPKDSLLISAKARVTTEPNTPLTSGFAQAGGHLQLIDTAGGVQDLVGWGTANAPAIAAAPAPAPGQTLLRNSIDIGPVNSGNNASDFALHGEAYVPPTPAPKPAPATAKTTKPAKAVAAVVDYNAPLQITELLPNPGAPETDANDEFIELYNPTTKPVALKGYKIQTGTSAKYGHTFDGEVIGANSYLVIRSETTSITLSNSGGVARLLDPNGKVVMETGTYDAAADNQSWSLVNNEWHWTSAVTPGEANVLSDNKVATATLADKDDKQESKASATNQSGDKQNESSTAVVPHPSSVNPSVLAAVSAGAVGYGAYEYREDIKNRLYKFRRNRSARAADRAKS
jgi:predicted extracellular nuclease